METLMPARKTAKVVAPAALVKAVKPAKVATKPPAAKPVAAKPASKALAQPPAPKPAKPRAKLVRDSFTMPQADFALIDVLKVRALGFKRATKKSELLRAGLQALAAMPPAALKAALGQLVPLKAGRPKKGAGTAAP
jgi:hypothetical protein